MRWVNSGFKASDWVEVKSAEEILATLDSKAELDNMPFMPEMLAHCGRRYRVLAAAHKTCDTVNKTGGRRVHDAVHLDMLRCDGAAHGNCQANCLLFWKTQWLTPVRGPDEQKDGSETIADHPALPGRLDDLTNRSSVSLTEDGESQFTCQATRLFDASEPLSPLRLSQYSADLRSRNVGLGEGLKTMLLAVIYNLRKIGVGYRLAVWLYGVAHRLLRGFPAPVWEGSIPKGQPTPEERLDLEIGETVEVKGVDEILVTLNASGHNRGLRFDPEMVPYCGKRFTVSDRVKHIVDEQTGKMLHFENPCIVLDGVVCRGQYSSLRHMCPRRITPYWREIWLKRIQE